MKTWIICVLNKNLLIDFIFLLVIGELQTRFPHAASQHLWSPGQSVSKRQSDWIVSEGSHLPLASTTFGQTPNLRIGSDPLINESDDSA